MKSKIEDRATGKLKEVKEKCPKCGGNPLIVDSRHGRVICPHCGKIVRTGLKDGGKFGVPLKLRGR